MNKIIIGSFLLLSSFSLFARELNYIESKIFRLSGHERVDEWVLPFYRYHKKTFPNTKFNIFGSLNPDLPDVIDDIDSKDEEKITARLDSSFGKPYDASAKVLVGYRYKKFLQTFSANAGAVAIINDPVFPELNAILFHDYILTSAYVFKFGKKLTLIPRLIYGRRKVLDSSFTAAQLANEKPNTKIKNSPWEHIGEISLNSKYLTTHLDFVFEVNSYPFINNEYEYWDSNLGVKSKNIKKYIPNLIFKRIDAYLSYSPAYGGNYDVSRTIRGGIGVEFNDKIMIDVFFEDEFLFGSLVKLNTSYFTLSAFTFERSYDDYHTQKSRQYGLSLTAQY